jgi:hypothetical protein
VVAAAWGEESDWYRNIQAQPTLAVTIGRDRYVPAQRILPPDEAFMVFQDWTRRQRGFARLMLSQIGHAIDVPEAERRALVARFPFIGLSPRLRQDYSREMNWAVQRPAVAQEKCDERQR